MTTAQYSKELHLLGGTNLLADPLRIDDNENARAKNLYPLESRKLAKRKAAGFFSAIHTGYNVGDGTFDWLDQENLVPLNLIIPQIAGCDFAHAFMDTVTGKAYFGWGEFNPNPLETRKVQTFEIPFLQGFRPKLLHFRGDSDYIIALPGTPVPVSGSSDQYSTLYLSNATGQMVMSGNAFDPLLNPCPKVVGTYRRRAVWANFGTGYENVFVLSDPAKPFTLPASPLDSAFTFRLGAMAGDEIVAVAEVTQSVVGSPTASVLLILGRHTAFIMTGEPEVSTATSGYTGDAVINQIQQKCGCASPETLVKTPYGWIWASDDDVWKFDYGSMPMRIGSKIRPALQVSNPPKRWCWHAEYSQEDGSYRLAIIGEGQVTSDDVLPCQDQWWLDLRDGMPQSPEQARWWGPQRYVMQETEGDTPIHAGTFIMAADRRAAHDEALYALHVGNHPIYAGNVGYTNIVIVDLNASEGWDNARPENYIDPDDVNYPLNAPTVVGRNSYADNEVSIELLTKRFDFEDRYVDKLALGLELSMWANDLCALRCETICDGGKMVDDQTVVVDQTGFALDVDLEGTRETHEYQAVLIPPGTSDRYMGKTLQYRIYDVPGYQVGPNNTSISFMNAAGVAIVNAVMTKGSYATLTAFLAALVAAVDAASLYVLGTSGSFVTLALTLSGTPVNFYIEFGDRPGRKIGSQLGFNTSVNASPAASQAGDTKVPSKVSTALELAGIVLKWFSFGRSPS